MWRRSQFGPGACALAALALAGCGSVCQRPPAAMADRKSAQQPHVAVAIPLETANRWIAAKVPSLREVTLPVPQLSALLPQIGKLSARVRGAELLPSDGEGALLGMTLEVRHEDVALVEMTARARLLPTVKGWQVVLALRPADIEAIKPQLAPGARQRIEEALLRRLPEIVRRFVPPGQVAPIADALVSYLGARAYPLIRKALLSRLGDATSLSFDLPRIPLARARVRSLTDPLPHLLIEIQTPLPVRRGLLTYRVKDPRLVQITLAGSAVAELGNCAMVSGLLPQRYDGKLKPAPRGEHWPRFDWYGGNARPLKIFVTKTSKPCMTMRIGARPRVGVVRGKLVVGVVDGAVEQLQGSALVKLGAWLKDVGERPVAFSKKLVSQLVVRVGAETLAFEVRDAAVTEGMFVFGVRIDAVQTPAKRPAATQPSAGAKERAQQPTAAKKPPAPFEMVCWPR